MGNCNTTTQDDKNQSDVNFQIQRQIEMDKRNNESTIKLLLLVLKQLKIIHDNGFSDDDLFSKRNLVYGNVIQEHCRLIHAIMAKHAETEPMREHIYVALKELWADKGVQSAMNRKSEFYVPDCAQQVFDVGGQRSQRKKWIHCFDDVRALIFVTAMSEFDQVLMEDGTTVQIIMNRSSRYIEKKFFMANEVPNKSIYCHHTCATDTKQVQFVLDSTLDVILSSKLKGCGLY
uniref:G-protein alpha subunit n=1 Tax=Meloidogyne hapla TaxID=6305 RepID=A0A1I8BDC2_MELHA